MVKRMNKSNQFGNYLMNKIMDSNLSIAQYAEMIGVDKQSIYHHVNKETMPKIRILRKYAKFYGDNVGDLIAMVRSDWGYYNG